MLLIMRDFVRRNPDKRALHDVDRDEKADSNRFLTSRVVRHIL
jgi:hypothetical protein